MMNQSPRIKPTSIKGGDANPKAVENRRAKVVANRGNHRLADLGWGRSTCPYGRWAPPLMARLLVSSRFFSLGFDVELISLDSGLQI
jgi:hypothetical protein